MFDMLTKIEPREGTLIFINDKDNIILLIDRNVVQTYFYSGDDAEEEFASYGIDIELLFKSELIHENNKIRAYLIDA